MSKLDKKLIIAMLAVWIFFSIFSADSIIDEVAEIGGSTWREITLYTLGTIIYGSCFIANYLIAKLVGAQIGKFGVVNFGFFLITIPWMIVANYSWDYANSNHSSTRSLWGWLDDVLPNTPLANEVMDILAQYFFFLDGVLQIGLYAFPVLGWLWSSLYMIWYRNGTGRTFTDNVLDL